MKPESSMQAWGRGLRREKGSLGELGRAFSGSRMDGFNRVKELKLPSYEFSSAPLASFLEHPESHLPTNEDPNRIWLALLDPKDQTHLRYRKLVPHTEITPFIRETVKEHDLPVDAYDVVIAESKPQRFGGNIIINDAGEVYIEVSRGGQGMVADGSHDPNKHGDLFIVRKDPYLGSLKYSWEDGEVTEGLPLRASVYAALLTIPHEGEGREMKFTPGYYEFHLVDKAGDGKQLDPVFIDSIQDPAMTIMPP